MMVFAGRKKEKCTLSQEVELNAISEYLKVAKVLKLDYIVLCSKSLSCVKAAKGNYVNIFWNLKDQQEGLKLLKKEFIYSRLVFALRKCLTTTHFLASRTIQSWVPFVNTFNSIFATSDF